MKHALLFLERNMGNGYAHAYPPVNPVLSWWLRNRVLPRAQTTLETDGHSVSLDGGVLPPYGTATTFVSRHFTVYSLLIQPDTHCTDLRARNPKFTLHAVFPSNLNFISGPFQAFLSQCRTVAWNTLQSGQVEALRVPIPDNLFLNKH
jgi:hypothetical protein